MDKSTEIKRFLTVEKKIIEISKWIEGTIQKKDPGDEYVLNWIDTSAVEFRKKWNESKCKNCAFIEECGHFLKTECEKYKEVKIVKNKKNKNNISYFSDTEYIECACKHFGHAIRIVYNKDENESIGEFYLEFKIGKYPSCFIYDDTYSYDKDTTKFQHFKMNLSIKLSKIVNYFKCVWWAIKGRPEWYHADVLLLPDEAVQLSRFIQKHLNKSFNEK